LTYACGVLAMNPGKMMEFGRLYMVTLKNACKLHGNTRNNLVLRALDVWHPWTHIHYNLVRAMIKMTLKNLSFPETLIAKWRQTRTDMNLRDDVELIHLKLEDLKSIFNESNTRLLEENRHLVHEDFEEKLSIDEFFLTGDMRDSYLVKYWCYNILDLAKLLLTGKYSLKTAQCWECGEQGDQPHFTNECKLFETFRKEFSNKFESEKLEVKESEFHGFIHNIKREARMRVKAKKDRARIIDAIKDYIVALHKGLKQALENYSRIPKQRCSDL